MQPVQKSVNRYLPDYQLNSGTATAFSYAAQEKKQFINLFAVIN